MKWLGAIRASLCVLLVSLVGVGSAVAADDKAGSAAHADSIPPGVQGSANPLIDNPRMWTGQDLLDASFPNSIPIFGTNVRIRVGGYAKADFIRDFEYIGDPFEFEMGSIAVEGSPERDLGGTTTFHAKQSRVNFDLRSKARWKNGTEYPLQVYVEFDWFFDSPAMALNTRLRLAYGVIGRLLAGQCWTTSGDLTALPGTIDFSAGDAVYGGRVGQIRWTDRIGQSFRYALALEQRAVQIDNPSDLEGASRAPWPNVAGMINWKSKAGSSIQLGADVFPVNWSGPNTVPNVTKTGYAVIVMSRVLLSVKEHSDAFVWGGGFGDGMGDRIISLEWDGKATGVVTPGGLRLAPSWFAYAGYSHYWNKSLNSTISTNWTATDLAATQSDDTIQKAGSVHANLIWFPYELVSTGIEYMWGMRENRDGAEGTASRVQAMLKFKFN